VEKLVNLLGFKEVKKMYYLVNGDDNASHQMWLWMVLRSAVHPVHPLQWMTLICCGKAVKRKGILTL